MCESEGGHGWVRTEELFQASLKVLKEMYGLEKRKQSSFKIIILAFYFDTKFFLWVLNIERLFF